MIGLIWTSIIELNHVTVASSSRHVMRGLGKAFDDCESGCNMVFSSSSVGGTSAKGIADAADKVVDHGVSKDVGLLQYS